MNTDLYFQKLEKSQEYTRHLIQRAEEILVRPPETFSDDEASVLSEILAQLSASMEELEVSEEELREQANQLQTAYEQQEVSQQRYQDLFDFAPDAYLTTNVYGVIHEANQAAVKLLGLPPGILVSKPLANFVPEDRRATFRTMVNKFRSSYPVLVWEGQLQSRDRDDKGLAVEVEFTVSPDTSPTYEQVTLRWLIRDITLRKQAEAEAELARAHHQRVTLSARMHNTRESERKNIAREVHDQLGGNLTAMKIDLAWLERHLPQTDPAVTERMRQLTEMISTNIEIVRQIAGELRPGVLDDLGLLPALEWQLAELKKRTGLTCQLSTDAADIPLTSEQATAIFRLFQEALANISNHAGATQVDVRLNYRENQLELEIQDNGLGISADAIESTTAWGLIGMRERAALLDGTVSFEGTRGAGTTVKICIPVG